MENNESFKSGFIALIGRPNVGKSTLLNEIIGQKIAIMSNKPQTTRNKIQGVYTTDDAQMIFIDTPGIHKPKHKLGDFMIKVATNALGEVDLILLLVDAVEGIGRGDRFIIEKLKAYSTPVFLVINKIDEVHPNDLLSIIDDYKDLYDFAEIIPISALKGNNVNRLLKQIKKTLPDGPKYYPADQVTDHPEKFVISELIREKVLQLTREEVPHSIAVVIDHLEQREDKDIIDVMATIIVERGSQKGIVIGKQGSLLKEIGKRARMDIENLLGSKVFLELWVKVQKDWRNKSHHLRHYGFNKDDY